MTTMEEWNRALADAGFIPARDYVELSRPKTATEAVREAAEEDVRRNNGTVPMQKAQWHPV